MEVLRAAAAGDGSGSNNNENLAVETFLGLASKTQDLHYTAAEGKLIFRTLFGAAANDAVVPLTAVVKHVAGLPEADDGAPPTAKKRLAALRERVAETKESSGYDKRETIDKQSGTA